MLSPLKTSWSQTIETRCVRPRYLIVGFFPDLKTAMVASLSSWNWILHLFLPSLDLTVDPSPDLTVDPSANS
eukprot:6391833-Amphidinium_carterae.1